MRVNSSLVLAVSVLLLNSSGRVGFAQAPGGVDAPARVQIGSPSVPSVYQLRVVSRPMDNSIRPTRVLRLVHTRAS